MSRWHHQPNFTETEEAACSSSLVIKSLIFGAFQNSNWRSWLILKEGIEKHKKIWKKLIFSDSMRRKTPFFSRIVMKKKPISFEERWQKKVNISVSWSCVQNIWNFNCSYLKLLILSLLPQFFGIHVKFFLVICMHVFFSPPP